MTTNLGKLTRLAHGATVGRELHRLLRDRIIRGDMPPGSRLSETEIAVAYSVSRQPVREAFIKLAEELLVEIRPQRGTFVSLISVPAVMTACFIREAVEVEIVRKVAKDPNHAQLRALDDRIAEQMALSTSASGEHFMLLDEEFHRALAEFAGQAAVADRLEEMKIPMNRVRHISTRQGARARLIAQHAAVVEAIRARDPLRAEAAMRVHLREILTDLPGIVAAHPAFFERREEMEAMP